MKKKLVVLVSIALVMCSLLCACACSHCLGNGKIPCTNSKCKDGYIICNECNGTEKINVKQCFRCDGLGHKSVACPKCNGLGKVQNPFTWEYFTCEMCGGHLVCQETCKECDGKGEFYDKCTNCEQGSLGECTTCHGEGAVDCPYCQGE